MPVMSLTSARNEIEGMGFWNLIHRPEQNSAPDDPGLSDPYEEPLPAVRSHFGSQGTIVYGWPSTGGVWVHETCYGVELEFLDLPRFETSSTERHSDPEAEDTFCQRLQWIGGRFFESETAYNWQQNKSSARENHEVWLAWPAQVPSGGVWVLWTKGIEDAEKGVARIRNAFNMDERCKAIEMLGGKFYKDWEEVEEPK